MRVGDLTKFEILLLNIGFPKNKSKINSQNSCIFYQTLVNVILRQRIGKTGVGLRALSGGGGKK